MTLPETDAPTAPQAPWRRAMVHVRGLVSGPPLDTDLDVTVHLHPDRSVGEVLLLTPRAEGGRARFETATSNGGLTAHPGKDWWRWEQEVFDGEYDGAPAAQRPKYGALNHRRLPAGGSVRFGSSHLRLSSQVLARTSFCYPAGSTAPSAFGTAEHMALVALADADDADTKVLDRSVEAHVHGALRLNRDVAALVLDPSFRGTDVEEAASALPFPVEWHRGFVLSVDELAGQVGRLGPDVVVVGGAVSQEGVLDARIIGEAVRVGIHDTRVLDDLWQCVARLGEPA